jgi:5-methylcytosine-specific restriction enzyme B
MPACRYMLITPGTGKTYIAQELAHHLTTEANVKIVQFHPAYSYEDFFEGYRPTSQSGGHVGFALTAGPLRSLVDRANENPVAPYVLIIDEINRGNLAKIFGELYFLLEYRDKSIDLLYSSDNTEPFSLPKNR